MAVSPRLDSIPDRTAVNALWLIKLRWAQVAGQAGTVLVAKVALGTQLHLLPLVGLVAVGWCPTWLESTCGAAVPSASGGRR
jgi:hypothetical protein